MKLADKLRRLLCLVICFAMILQPMTFLSVFAEETTNLFTNGIFADANGDGKAEGWTCWFGTVAEAPSSVGEDGLTITADSSVGAQRLTVHQTVSGLDSSKTYVLSGRYNVISTGSGSLEIRYNTSNQLAKLTSKTDGWQTFSQEITGVESIKLEIVVSQGATLTCSVDDISLVEKVVESEPDPEPETPTYVNTLLLNGTFLDGSDEGTVPDDWTFWNGSAVAATTSIGADGLTITADSSLSAQRLSVNQTVTGLDASKTYCFTGENNITSKTSGALDIGYYANATGSIIKERYQSVTNGVQTFEIIFTGCTSAKLEAAVSNGATMTCTINNFRLEEVPSYTVTFDANGGTGSMEPVTASGSIVLPECTFTAPEDTTFAGWLVGGEVKAAGDTITFGSDITVKAVWDDGNLLSNPTYANTDISSISGWNYYPAYNTNAGTNYNASVTDGVFSGTVLGGSNLILHQTVPMTEDTLNKSYRFTADIKTEDITGYAMFKIYLQDASAKQLSSFSSSQIKGDTDWTTLTMEFDVPASVGGVPVASIKLEQYILKGTGTASFSNPKIVETGEFIPDPEGDPMDSLVKNGGYETTLAGFPASWNLWTSTGGLNAVSDREVFKDGYSSLHLSNVTPGSDSRGSVHQTFNINTDDLKELWGQSVKISQWVKTENFVGDALMIRVHYAAVSGAYLAKSIPVQSTQDWTYYEYIIDLPDTNFATIKIENLYEYGQGDVWIDNTVVTKYIKAKSLTLNAEKVVLPVDGTQDLTVAFAPANTTIQEVVWTTSDASVATVENGTITAVAPGCATITVTHVDGMKKEIAVLVADSEIAFHETIAIETAQNISKSDSLSEGYAYQVAANPQFGTFLVENGEYTYYPAKDFNGSDSVTLLASSDEGKCLVVVPLTVTAVNGAPEFGKMTILTKVGEAVTGAFSATDPENDDLTYSVVKQPTNGTVTVEGGSYTFTPNAGFQGYDAVTFSVSDGVNSAEKEVTIYVAPDASALLATVKTEHARLLADDARFEELQGLIQTDENAKAWFAIVKRDADKLLDDPTPVPYQCPDGVRLDTQGSKDVLNLAFMYRMTGGQVYLERAKLELLYLCGLSEETYPDWHPSHLLDTAMTANGVAIAYDWLYDDLTAEEKDQVELAIYQNALVEARKQFEANHMFVTNTENWNYICNGGFIIAALALAHNENAEYNALAGEIMQRCYASIQYGLPQYAPEGASIEGISYWDYGTRYLVSLLASISSATTHNPFLDTPDLNITAEYPIYLSGKAGSYNYSDNDMVDAFGYLNMWLAHTYGDYSWNWYHKYYMEKGYDPTVYDLLYYYPAEYGGDAPVNLDKWYTNQAVTTMRHDFTDPMSSFLGFKGGLNGAPHGDVDIGSFWAEDFGKDDYNLTGYWEIAPGGTRWNYYRKNAMGHNTLVFNPTKGANQTVGAYAGKTEQVLNEANGGYTILDMTDAYQDNAVSVKRGFAYFDRTQVLIRDEFTLKAPGTAYWQMHTKATVEISEDGKTATLTQGNATLLLKLVGENANDGLRLAAMDATTYDGVEYEGLKSNEDYTKVYVKADGVQKAVFNVLITPVDMETPEVKTLDRWNEYDFTAKEPEPPHEHDWSYTVNEDGTHTATCACNETVTEPHTFVDGVCACGAEEPEPEVETITVYFMNNWKWTEVKAYFWIGDQPQSASWPGDDMTLFGNDGTYDIYSIEIPTNITGLQINGLKDDGSGSRDQTPDITSGWYDGICYYMLWDNGNQVGSQDISVTLPVEELAIIRQPVSVEGNLGENAVFTVEATGEGLTYQWFYSQEEGKWYESAATGFDTATLTVQLLAYRDGQKYRCEITDANGETLTTDEVTMTIRKSIVEITSQPVGVTNAVLGQTYTYTVEATGESLTYLWEYSANGGETWQQTWLEGYNTATLTVAMNSNRDGNLYRCVVSSLTDQKTSEAAILSLPQFSAEIITQPVDVAAGTGETISFTVEAEGEGLSFTWYRSKNNGETWDQTWLNGYNTNTLSFVANEGRCGMYKCLVKDVSGKGEYTEAVTLSMKKGEPELQITQHPANQMNQLVGQTVTFTVEAVGEGLTYAWYRSDDNGETWVRTWMAGYNEKTLTFAATEGRQDLYRCVVTDLYGNTVTSQSAEFKLKESTLQITKQPEDVTIAKAGDTVTFTVEATGEGLTYCWYASTDGETWTQTWLTGYNTANLSFAGTAGRIAKQYKCVITDETGNTVETVAVKATVG